MKKFLKSKKTYILSLCAIAVLMSTLHGFNLEKSSTEKNLETEGALSYDSDKLEDVVYLSDIPYMKAEIGWKTIGLDKTVDNAALTMNIDGTATVIKKGIWAHATSTVEYDISNYKD